jgi:hypothetical protein
MARTSRIAYDNRSEPEDDGIDDTVVEMLEADFDDDFMSYVELDNDLLLKICKGTATLEETLSFKCEFRRAYMIQQERYVSAKYDEKVADLYDPT